MTLAGRVLTITGRGSFVFVDEVSLDELLARYDRAYPEFTDETREEVAAAYRKAVQGQTRGGAE